MPLSSVSICSPARRRAAHLRDQSAEPETNSTTRPRMASTREEGTWTARCIVSAPDEQPAEEDGGGDEAKRVQAAQERGHDPGEAVAAGEALQQPVLDADDLDDPGKPGEAAGQRQGERLEGRHVDARSSATRRGSGPPRGCR